MPRLTKEEILEKYGPVEGEKRWKAIERSRKHYAENKESHKAYTQEYRQRHPESRKLEYKRRLEKNPNCVKEQYQKYSEYNKQRSRDYRQKHKEKVYAYQKMYNQRKPEVHRKANEKYQRNNRDKINAYYYKNQLHRAGRLVSAYRTNDLEQGRGECTITPEWVVENIFTSKCVYCGCGDWTKLGCDRIDNFKPHTPDNVVCCCGDCNNKRGRVSYLIFKAVSGNPGIKIVYSDD